MAATRAVKRAATYERVSVDRRDERKSVGEQHQDNMATIAREGWAHAGAFTDNDRSASRYARKPRPDYLRLVEHVRAGGCDVVVTWELSRLSRDLGTLVAFRDLCRGLGVLWSIGGRTYDPNDERDALMLIFEACQAEGESARTSKRVRRDTAHAAEQGRPHGRVLYGYQRSYDPGTRKLIGQHAHPQRAAVVGEVFARFAAGESLWTIGRSLRERGVPSPGGGKWSVGSVRRILVNPGYIARRVHQGREVGEATWPALVDAEVFDRCQARLFAADRPAPVQREAKYLLTGIAACAVCDESVTVRKPRGYPCYTCGSGFHVSRKIDWLDAYVIGELIGWCERPEAAAVLAGPERATDAFHAARTELLSARAELDDYYRMAGEGRISAEGVARIEPRILDRIAALESVTAPRDVPGAVVALVGDPRGPALVWDGLGLADRREAVRTLMRVRIGRTRQGARSFDPASVQIEWRHKMPAADVRALVEHLAS